MTCSCRICSDGLDVLAQAHVAVRDAQVTVNQLEHTPFPIRGCKFARFFVIGIGLLIVPFAIRDGAKLVTCQALRSSVLNVRDAIEYCVVKRD
jgi:hypothetical protein